MMKVLLVGPGLIGSKHAELINQSHRLKLAGIVSPSEHKHSDLIKTYGSPVVSSVELALENLSFDAVLISSPNEYHHEHCKLFLTHNYPVFIEKPFTSALIEAQDLINLATDKKLPILVGHHRTYSPYLKIAQDFISSETFGELVSFTGSAQFFKPNDYFEAAEWRTRKKGGGPILINLIHEIGIMRSLCGEINKIFAFKSNKIRQYEVEETVVLSVEFKNGALGSFTLSDTAASNKSWEMTSGENSAYPYYPNDFCYHIAGTKASLDFPSMYYRCYPSNKEASWWKDFSEGRLDVKPENPLKLQLDHFADVLEGLADPLVSGHSGYQNMLVIEAIHLSLKEERAVSLDSFREE